MSKTSSLPELLQVCLWDLQAGCTDLAERLPSIAAKASNADLRSRLQDGAAKARERAGRLAAVSDTSDGPPNLWMGGILDDAEHDTRSVEEGTLLDIALIGAIRKALMAELASIATAEAVATSREEVDVLQALSANEIDLLREDAALSELLSALA